MHNSVLDFVTRATRDLDVEHVLDVGAMDINGSARDLFPEVDYVGVDLEKGPGVDTVGDAHHLVDLVGARTFDLVLCLEMLEHDSQPWITAAQLAKVVKPGGLVLVSARGNGFPLHNEPDCYRFMEAGIRAVLEAGGLTVERLDPDPEVSGWFARCSPPVSKPKARKPKGVAGG